MKLKRVWLVKLIFVLAFAIILAPKAKTTTASDADKPFYKNAMVNTYVYDEKGKRTKDKKILAGKAVGCYSMINYVGDKPYIMIGQNKYVAYMNVVGLDCQLNHNSYIYSSSGKRIKNSGVLLKNGSVTVYGGKKKINGSKYWAIGVGLYVKASNVETPKELLSFQGFIVLFGVGSLSYLHKIMVILFDVVLSIVEYALILIGLKNKFALDVLERVLLRFY
ncbi:SLAP domain-containing protein [Lactobacillus delbrueckii subsp. bulgaricus]